MEHLLAALDTAREFVGPTGLLVGGVVVGLAIVILIWLAYMGMFSTPKVYEETLDAFLYAYLPHRGPYPQIAPVYVKVMDTIKSVNVDGDQELEGRVAMLQRSEAVSCGVFFDAPSKVKNQAELRSIAGFVLPVTPGDQGAQRFAALLEKAGLKVVELPQTKILAANMPYRNMFSFFIGPMRAYPPIGKALEAKGMEWKCGSVEMFRFDRHKKPYLFYGCPLTNTDKYMWDFFMPAEGNTPAASPAKSPAKSPRNRSRSRSGSKKEK